MTSLATMRALRVARYGEPTAVLHCEEVEVPAPGPGQVRVRVGAAALNLPDVLLCRGTYALKPPLPFTPGLDLAGTVEATGPGVAAGLIGARVAGVSDLPHGALAEMSLLAANRLYSLPDGVDDGAAAAMLIAFTTAHVSLRRRGGLVAGEQVLVLGAAGGVGTAAIQVAKILGARVIAVASGAERVASCLALGADVGIDLTVGDMVEQVLAATGGRGVDVVYDPVGGELFHAARRCTASEGRLLIIGFAGGLQDIQANQLLYRNQSAIGVYLGAYSKDEAGRTFMAGVWADVMDWYGAGRIRPVIEREVGLDGVATALEDLAARRVMGRIVVRP
jgi:NADPH2:quinone reductase